MRHYGIPIITAVALCAAACSANKGSAGKNAQGYAGAEAPVRVAASSPSAAIPKAVVYKTNGDFIHNVPVTMSADRKEITSYPAPSDISPSSVPLKLDNGYLLDRRGIGPNTAFTSYTYEEYSRLANAPSLKQLKDAIIPGALVTEIVMLPMNASDAGENIDSCNRLIKEGFPGCEILLKREAVQLTPQ